jgi:hypothetical protein
MTTAKAKKVFWTEEEKLIVLHEAIRLRWSPPYMGWPNALRTANGKLPEDRQRPASSLATSSVALQKEAETLRAKEAHKQKHAQHAPEVVEETQVVDAVPTEQPIEPQPEAQDDPLHQALDKMAQSVCDLLMPKIQDLLKQKLRESLLNSVQQVDLQALVGEAIKKERLPDRVRKPKVVIVGLISQQITTIKQEYGDTFDLTFHQASENYALVKDRVKNAEWVLINTTKIDHSLYHTIKKNTDHHISIPGDLSSFRNRLNLLKKDLGL